MNRNSEGFLKLGNCIYIQLKLVSRSVDSLNISLEKDRSMNLHLFKWSETLWLYLVSLTTAIQSLKIFITKLA